MKQLTCAILFFAFLFSGCNKEQSSVQESSVNSNESSLSKMTGNADFSTSGEVITKEEAIKMTNNFQFEVGGIRSHTFSKSILMKVMDQENIVAVRFYHGIEDGKTILVVVGVDKTGNDSGIYLERSSLCPPDCPN